MRALARNPLCRRGMEHGPSLVAPIAERNRSQYVGSDWTAGVNASPVATGHRWVETHARGTIEPDPQTGSQHVAAATGWIVLAEETWLRWLDWKLATETRVGARLEPKIWASIDNDANAQGTADPQDTDGHSAAGKALGAHVLEFVDLVADEYLARAHGSHSMVVRNVTYRFQTPGGSWLAFNSALAEHIGWRPAPDGLFRWLDSDGNIAAESIWWQDGFAQQRPPHFEDEVGFGWLVRVSARAWGQLAASVGACVDWRRLARLAQEQPPRECVATDPALDAHVQEA